MFTGLSHVSIVVPDIEAAVRALKKRYGLEAGPRVVNEAQGVRLAYVTVGAGKIELPFATLAGSRQNVVVDMTAVEFIASIGIRHLVMAADALWRASCRLVLLDPTPLVTNVLVNTGLEDILPIVRSEDEARAVFASPHSG